MSQDFKTISDFRKDNGHALRATGLILHHEVTQDGADNQQLEPVATTAKALLKQETLEVTADAGYSNGEQFQACEDAEITAYVPPEPCDQ